MVIMWRPVIIVSTQLMVAKNILSKKWIGEGQAGVEWQTVSWYMVFKWIQAEF
jgi:hypothetical protein